MRQTGNGLVSDGQSPTFRTRAANRGLRALSSSMRRGRVSAKSCPQAPKSIGVCFLPDHVKKAHINWLSLAALLEVLGLDLASESSHFSLHWPTLATPGGGTLAVHFGSR